MYTPPVPPVTMFSVLPSKFGVADAAAVPAAPSRSAVGLPRRGAGRGDEQQRGERCECET